MANIDEVHKLFPDIFIENPQKRLKKNISSKVIYSYNNGELKSSRNELRETKKIKEDVKADINIYENAVVISTYRGNDTVGVSIESKDIAGVLRQLFELAWKKPE